MKKPEIVIRWSNEKREFVATVPVIPQIEVHGKFREKTFITAAKLRDEYIAKLKRENRQDELDRILPNGRRETIRSWQSEESIKAHGQNEEHTMAKKTGRKVLISIKDKNGTRKI